VVLCGGVFVAPLLLLQHGSAQASRVRTASSRTVQQDARARTLYSVALPSQLVRYQTPVSATASVVTAPTVPPTTSTSTTVPSAPPTTTPGTTDASRPAIEEASVPVKTTPTPAPPPTPPPTSAPPAVTEGERGQATWYAAAPAGRCARPTLPFGTILTVTNVATGASTTCVVDDREEAGYPRVVDMSPSGFAQLADPSQGVVDVSISW
jgi:rare lipoprotein A (peptidoglycan hydrolase)